MGCKKNICPIHKQKLKVSKGWRSPDGLDPKMRRLACLECTEYWYKAPKHCLMRADAVQIAFGIAVC